MSPRYRCLLLALLVVLILVAPAAADDDNSWVGKTVLTKTGDVKLRRMDDDGKIVFEAKLTEIDHRVLREEGRWVRVREGGRRAGWRRPTSCDEQAIAEQEKALADKSLDKDDRAKMERRLALYREKKPYRDED